MLDFQHGGMEMNAPTLHTYIPAGLNQQRLSLR